MENIITITGVSRRDALRPDSQNARAIVVIMEGESLGTNSGRELWNFLTAVGGRPCVRMWSEGEFARVGNLILEFSGVNAQYLFQAGEIHLQP